MSSWTNASMLININIGMDVSNVSTESESEPS